MTWDLARTEMLRQLWAEGLSAGLIASRLGGTSRSAVNCKAIRIGLPRRTTSTLETVVSARAPRSRRKNGGGGPAKAKQPTPPIVFDQVAFDRDDVAHTTLVDREPGQCSWVIGDVRAGRMCGLPVVPRAKWEWCAKHLARGCQGGQSNEHPDSFGLRPKPVPSALERIRDSLRDNRIDGGPGVVIPCSHGLAESDAQAGYGEGVHRWIRGGAVPDAAGANPAAGAGVRELRDNRERGVTMPKQHDGLQCELERLDYDFTSRIGRLYMVDGDCCDMSACIEMFAAIDRDVSRIETFSGTEADTCYAKPLGKWVAYDAEGHAHG
jgi:GcrA cell cycle regulator